MTEKPYDGYFFCDTETTGLSEEKHGINQLCVIITDLDFRIKAYFKTLVKPANWIEWTKEASEVSGITTDTVVDAPSEQAVADTIRALTQDRGRLRFAGFNTEFDQKMMFALAQRTGPESLGYFTDYAPLCLMKIACSKLPDLPPVWNEKWKKNQTHTLALVTKAEGIAILAEHDSAGDIYATLQLARVFNKRGWIK